VAEGSFQCPVCRTRTNYTQYSQRRWFSFFFVPLFPLSQTQEFVGCHQCGNQLNLQSLPASQGIREVGVSVSGLALGSMWIAFFALLTICVFFISLPLSIAAVVMGHLGLNAIRKNQPVLEGGWQAITALIVGYMSMFLSTMVGLLLIFGPQWFPRPESERNAMGAFAEGASVSRDEQGVFSAKRALSAAETLIATKGNLPPGRGNTETAIKLANAFAERMKKMSDESFTKGSKNSLLLSGGEYLTYCELHPDRCLFLVHVPAYREFTDEAKKVLAELAWFNAQVTVAEKLKPDSKLALGLRGNLIYGDILIGKTSAEEQQLMNRVAGKKEDLLAFFVPPEATQSQESSEKGQLAAREAEQAEATEPDSMKDDPFRTGAADTAKMPDDDPFAEAEMKRTESKGEPEVNTTATVRDRRKEEGATEPLTDMKKPDVDGRRGDKPDSRPAPAREVEKSDFQNKIPVKSLTIIENKGWAFNSLAFSHDGKWLAAGKLDAAVYLFDASSGDMVTSKEKLDRMQQVIAIGFSHDNRHLVAASYSGESLSWSLSPEGKLADEKSLFAFKGEVSCLTTSPKHDFFIGGDKDGGVAYMPYGDGGNQVRLFKELKKKVLALWLPESGVAALATDGEKVYKFSLKDGKVLELHELPVKYPQHACFSKDGRQLVVTDYDHIRVFDTVNYKETKSIANPAGEMLHCVKLHPNGKWLATGLRAKTAIWDIASGEVLAYLESGTVFYDQLIAFNDAGTKIAITSNVAQQSIRIFEIADDPL
jgi:hypothetical protein